MKTFSGWNLLKERHLGAGPGKERELADPGSRKYHRATEEGVPQQVKVRVKAD